MSETKRWWYCTKHHTVESEQVCPAKDTLGPYATREEAEHALDTVQRRNEDWDNSDR